ncbi:MAG: hypothetical protein R2747_13375 [Pyrinomonadaceae bacterium]
MIRSKEEAYKLLEKLDAPSRLIKHVKLVDEAAQILIRECEFLNVTFDKFLVEVGVAIHDAGKILHPNELNEKGSEHEPAGEKLMLANGATPEQARCCVSHARYSEMEVSLEELLVALSDKLWKGKRVESLELEVIDRVAQSLSKDRWDLFAQLDSCFEKIASEGDGRLNRSVDA